MRSPVSATGLSPVGGSAKRSRELINGRLFLALHPPRQRTCSVTDDAGQATRPRRWLANRHGLPSTCGVSVQAQPPSAEAMAGLLATAAIE